MDFSRPGLTQVDYINKLGLPRQPYTPSDNALCPPQTLPPVLAPGLVAAMAARPYLRWLRGATPR